MFNSLPACARTVSLLLYLYCHALSLSALEQESFLYFSSSTYPLTLSRLSSWHSISFRVCFCTITSYTAAHLTNQDSPRLSCAVMCKKQTRALCESYCWFHFHLMWCSVFAQAVLTDRMENVIVLPNVSLLQFWARPSSEESNSVSDKQTTCVPHVCFEKNSIQSRMVWERLQLSWMVTAVGLALCSSSAVLSHPLAACDLFVVSRLTREAFVSASMGSWHEPVFGDEQMSFYLCENSLLGAVRARMCAFGTSKASHLSRASMFAWWGLFCCSELLSCMDWGSCLTGACHGYTSKRSVCNDTSGCTWRHFSHWILSPKHFWNISRSFSGLLSWIWTSCC